MVGITLALVLAVGAYLLGARIGDNSEAVRAESKQGYEDGFAKGRRRGYRATYAGARRRAERAAAEARTSVAPPAAAETQATPPPSDSSSDDSGVAAAEGDDSSEREPCIYGDGLCTPEENARENEAERICGGGGTEAEARPDLCGPG